MYPELHQIFLVLQSQQAQLESLTKLIATQIETLDEMREEWRIEYDVESSSDDEEYDADSEESEESTLSQHSAPASFSLEKME